MNIYTVLAYAEAMAMVLGLLYIYARGIRGVWPPASRKAFYLVWAWYLSMLGFAIPMYLEELGRGPAEPPLLALGALLLLVGGLFGTWGFLTLGAVRSSGARVDTLVVRGPYRYTRNPQYFGDSLVFWGLAAAAGSPLLAGFAALNTAIFYLLALLEERVLRERFGEDYMEYMRSVPRFLPRPPASGRRKGLAHTPSS